jgi:hypothetical protein
MQDIAMAFRLYSRHVNVGCEAALTGLKHGLVFRGVSPLAIEATLSGLINYMQKYCGDTARSLRLRSATGTGNYLGTKIIS